jgi:hypothetical protein
MANEIITENQVVKDNEVPKWMNPTPNRMGSRKIRPIGRIRWESV